MKVLKMQLGLTNLKYSNCCPEQGVKILSVTKPRGLVAKLASEQLHTEYAEH